MSKLEVADAEDAKQTYEDVSVKAVLGDKQKPSEDKDDSSTTDKDNSSTTDKDNSSTADKGDSSTAGKNDSTSSGSANGGEKGKTDTAAGKAGARTGDMAATPVWIAGIAVSAGVLIALRIRKRKIK